MNLFTTHRIWIYSQTGYGSIDQTGYGSVQVFASLLPCRFLYDVHVEGWVWFFRQRLEVCVSLIAHVITEDSLE